MTNAAASAELLNLLNDAIARELQVCIQYMLQHALGAGRSAAVAGDNQTAEQAKFIASHTMIYLPGASLRKVAIQEMRHADAIAERVSFLGGEPTTQATPIILGKSAREMLEIDREAEKGAIALYKQIIDVAGKAQDAVTKSLFQRILADERKHQRLFSDLLGVD